jgi:hypothetical protein
LSCRCSCCAAGGDGTAERSKAIEDFKELGSWLLRVGPPKLEGCLAGANVPERSLPGSRGIVAPWEGANVPHRHDGASSGMFAALKAMTLEEPALANIP